MCVSLLITSQPPPYLYGVQAWDGSVMQILYPDDLNSLSGRIGRGVGVKYFMIVFLATPRPQVSTVERPVGRDVQVSGTCNCIGKWPNTTRSKIPDRPSPPRWVFSSSAHSRQSSANGRRDVNDVEFPDFLECPSVTQVCVCMETCYHSNASPHIVSSFTKACVAEMCSNDSRSSREGMFHR